MGNHACRRPASLALATLFAAGVLFGPTRAEPPSWPQFRGPGGLASAPDQRIPDEFGPDRNVRWQREIPSGHSSPVIWGDRLFLTGYNDSTLEVLCYRRTDGELLWKKEFAMKGQERFLHRDATPAGPTPATDGERIHAYFGAYGLVTLDMQGNLVWEHQFQVEPGEFGTGSSPILHGDTLFLVRDVAGLSMAHAFDAATGEQRWARPRPQAGANYATPFIWKQGDREELVVAGSGALKSYDVKDGEPLWWVDKLTAIVCPSPTATGDVLYFGGWSTPNLPKSDRLATGFEVGGLPDEALVDVPHFVAHLDRNGDGALQPDEIPPGRARDVFAMIDFNRSGAWEMPELQGFLDVPVAPGRNVLVAVRGGGRGDVTESHVLWEKTKGLPYVASPLLHAGRLYYVKKGGFMSSVDVESGRALYEAQRLGIGGEYYASPVGIGDRVLVGSARGTMFVLGTGDELEIVARNDFAEGIFATPAVVENTMYVRTARHLWAIGAPSEPTAPPSSPGAIAIEE